MKPLRDAIRREAGRVWREKAQAEGLGLFLNEETITETMLLNLATACQGSGLFVRPFTKAQETKNGADWEFWFIQGAKSVGLRVQAKRLFPSASYDSLKPGGSQISNLIKRAGNCYPVYVFYNDCSTYPSSLPICSCNEYRAPSYRGCTLSTADAVAIAASNSASSLQHRMMPWRCLLCDSAINNTALPDVIARNLNRHYGLVSGDLYEANKTPAEFEAYFGSESIAHAGYDEPDSLDEIISDDGYHEPDWLERYLSERMLAGVILVGEAK